MGWRVLCVLALSACSQVFGLDEPARRMTDASPAMTDVAIDAVAPETWSAPIEITELTSGGNDDDPSVTDDQREIYFGSGRNGGQGLEDIWVAKRASTNEPWGIPTPVVELNTPASETTARVTGDGLTIFLASNRLTASLDIWYSTRNSRADEWDPPTRIGELSTAASDVSAASTDGRLHVILVTGPSTAQETLYTSTRSGVDQPWPTPTRIVELDNATTTERDPWEPTRRAVYFTREDPTDTTTDIYVSRRAQPSDPYGVPVKLNGVNEAGCNERDPWVSVDERLLVFSSDCSRTNRRIYFSTRLD